MGGHSPDKKTFLREERHQRSAEALSNALKLNLQGSVLLHQGEGADRHFALYVPEDKHLQVITALRHQFLVDFRGTEIHVWNGDDWEVRFKLDLPETFGAPILDALNRKVVRFAAALALTPDADPDEAVQRVTEALAHERGGI